ncbi:t-SNARE domain followed by hydrophobic stretch [Cryptosporidium bovis]|uniref:t-SNARE domain followed by hydrophobic stretch n=1 Tax=Cryptosporidium bovis TaxID=310047 RepID=UPI00351A5DA0|nr:t-SNARE domain followed by hydrophobic stretch [Cryptosporidium bovis]
MTFESSTFDNEEEMASVSPDIYGEWNLSIHSKITKLVKSIEKNIFDLNDYILSNQRASSIDEKTFEKIKLMINKIQNEIKKLDDALREWKIELAGDPISYRDSKLELDNYINQQKMYLEKVDDLNRKINDLSTRVTSIIGSNSLSFANQIDDNMYNDYNDYDFNLNEPNNIHSHMRNSNSSNLNSSYNNISNSNRNNYFQSNKFDNKNISSINKRELYGEYTPNINTDGYNSDFTLTSTEYQSRPYDQIDRQIARETAVGLGQIQSQMYEANQIFKNLASMVNEQGETIQNLETTIDNTVYSAKKAVTELKKAYNSNAYKFSLFANYGLPAFLFIILVVILILHFFNVLL